MTNSTGRFVDVEVTEVASGLRFPEGPVALSDGSVLVVEIEGEALTKVHPDGTLERLAEIPGGPNGAAIGPDGAVYLCNNGGAFEYTDLGGVLLPGHTPASWVPGSIQRYDLDSGELATLYRECDGRELKAPNDLVFDAHGGLWFTDHGTRDSRRADRCGVFYAKADGSEIREVLLPLDGANGVGLSPDGTRLYVAETYSGRVYEWALSGPGTVEASFLPVFAGGSVLYSPPGAVMFDSLAVDADGSVCVATLLSGGISVISPKGADHPDGGVEFLACDDPLITNICFGGPDRRTAWLTASSSGRLLRCTWPSPGAELAYSR